MTQTINQHEAVPEALQLVYAPIKQELAQVEEILRNELRSDYKYVDELVRYGCLLGGKRLRPALLLLAAKATGRVEQEHFVLAAVVEMIHTATLIHDDVLDEAQVRRHEETVNARWNNESSVLLGDYLFTHAFYLASTLNSTIACRLIGKATNVVCEGELRQIGSRADFDLKEDEYLNIIEAKTAELCSCSCRLGALFSGADPKMVEAASQYGRDLGVAFQIADDMLDLLGDEISTGKSLGTDLDKQKPTLPIIHALRSADGDDRNELINLLQENDKDRNQQLLLLPWLERFDAFDYTRDKARWYAQRARKQLESLEDSPAVEVLRSLTDFVVMRSQ